MTVQHLPGIEAFKNCPWKEAVLAQEVRSCQNYFIALDQRTREIGDSDQREALKILGAVCSMGIYLEQMTANYTPSFEGPVGRAFAPQDVTNQMAELFWEFLQIVDDAELKARLADIVWLHKGTHKREAAGIAVQALLESCAVLEQQDKFYAMERLARAVALSFELGRGGAEEQQKVLSAIKDWLANVPPEEADGADAHVLKLLLKYYPDATPHEWAARCALFAEKKRTKMNYYLQRSFLDLQLQFYEKAKISESEDEVQHVKKAIVTSFIEEATAVGDSAFRQSMLMSSAFEACRRYGLCEEFPSLHQDLLRIQKAIPEEMETLEIPLPDLSECREKAMEAVAGKDFHHALLSFSCIIPIDSRTSLSESAEQYIRKHPLLYLFPGSIINSDGKTISRLATLDLSRTGEDEDLLQRAIVDIIKNNIMISSFGFIQPALEIMRIEHKFTDSEIMPFVFYHPFIPEGHELFYLRGLLAGYKGDYAAACSYLIPQIENTLRYLLKQRGEVTSSFTSSGEQPEKSLEFLLDHQVIKDILGDDLTFLLRMLLCEKVGWNLRNLFAHGLLDYNALQSPECQYFWWLVQRMVFLPFATRHGLRSDEEG